MSFGATDFVGRLLAGPLEAELKVVESGGEQLIEALLVERKSGSDHVNVESSVARGLHERGKVGAGQWFPAGEVELHDTEFGGLTEDAGPGIGRQFVRARGKFLRIGAVDAVQRAPVSEFGNERQRICDSVDHDRKGSIRVSVTIDERFLDCELRKADGSPLGLEGYLAAPTSIMMRNPERAGRAGVGDNQGYLARLFSARLLSIAFAGRPRSLRSCVCRRSV